MVHEEERHGSARTDGLVPDLLRMESEDFLAAIKRASVA
jgi:hypothetical protein